MTYYEHIKDVMSCNEIYIHDLLYIFKNVKKNLKDWEKFIDNLKSYNKKDAFRNFDIEFPLIVETTIKELENYKEWKLIKYKNLNDTFIEYTNNEHKGTFSYDSSLNDIQILIRYFFDDGNYCLFKYG